jgi:hypothetical protein
LESKIESDQRTAKITLKNTGKHFAAAIQLDFIMSDGTLFYPVSFSENLLWLAPDEEQTITAILLDNSQYSFDRLTLRVEALNS